MFTQVPTMPGRPAAGAMAVAVIEPAMVEFAPGEPEPVTDCYGTPAVRVRRHTGVGRRSGRRHTAADDVTAGQRLALLRMLAILVFSAISAACGAFAGQLP